MNQVILSGDILKDPEMYTKDKAKTTLVARFSIVQKGWKKAGSKRGDAICINCVAFDQQAEDILKNLKKDMSIIFTGRVQPGSYIKDGKTIYTTDLIAEKIEILNYKQIMETSVIDKNGFITLSEGKDSNLPFN